MNKRSKQIGNNGAFKHGFYSRFFQSLSPDDLATLELGLEDEIAAARLAGRRMLELADETNDPRQVLRVLAVFSTHLTHLASLVRTRAILTGNSNDTAEAITTAIEAVAREMHIL